MRESSSSASSSARIGIVFFLILFAWRFLRCLQAPDAPELSRAQAARGPVEPVVEEIALVEVEAAGRIAHEPGVWALRAAADVAGDCDLSAREGDPIDGDAILALAEHIIHR